MRVVVLNTQVPFVRGGAEILAEGLVEAIAADGHDVELVCVPFKWYPPQAMLDGIMGSRLLDLSHANGQSIDRLITLKFPTYLAPHPNKSLWLVHQQRSAYDMWDTGGTDLRRSPLGGVMRDAIHAADATWIPDHKNIYTISRNIKDRLQSDLKCDADVLYPPVSDADAFRPVAYDDFFLLPSRVNRSKRQNLFIDALAQCKSRPKIVVVGRVEDDTFVGELKASLARSGREHDVTFAGMVDRKDLIELYNTCRGILFSPQDEDYGYVTIEAFYAGKAVISAFDSGGPLEFIEDDVSGIVTRIDTASIAAAMDRLWADRGVARTMGGRARDQIMAMNINWPTVVEKLLA